MDQIDYTHSNFLGNEVFRMERETEKMVVKSKGYNNNIDITFEVAYFDKRGIERTKIEGTIKDVCHEIVDSYINGFTIQSNLLLRKSIYTALDVTRGISKDKENAEELSEKVQHVIQPCEPDKDVPNS